MGVRIVDHDGNSNVIPLYPNRGQPDLDGSAVTPRNVPAAANEVTATGPSEGAAMRTHEQRVLVRGLAGLNAGISRFAMKAQEAGWEGEGWPHTPEEEAVLALQMVTLAGQLRIHAEQSRDTPSNDAEPIVMDGHSAPRQLDPRISQ